MTSMNMPGISLSLLNLTNVAAECSSTPSKTLLEYLDAPHRSPGWPATGNIYPLPAKLGNRKRADQYTEVAKEEKKAAPSGPKLLGKYFLIKYGYAVDGGPVPEKRIKDAITTAANDVMALEPDLTRWDTIVGDGDCGETCANGAKGVLEALKNGMGSDGDLVQLFRMLTEIIDGGFARHLSSYKHPIQSLIGTTRFMRRNARRDILHLPRGDDHLPRRLRPLQANDHARILRQDRTGSPRAAQTPDGGARRSSDGHGRHDPLCGDLGFHWRPGESGRGV